MPEPIPRRERRRTARPADLANLIARLMAGASIAQAAELLWLSDNSVANLLESPEGQRRIADAQTAVLQRAERALVTATPLAVQTLVLAMTTDETPMSVRVQAAAKLMDFAGFAKRIELTGADGGPLQVEFAAAYDALPARLEAMGRAIVEAEARAGDDETPRASEHPLGTPESNGKRSA